MWRPTPDSNPRLKLATVPSLNGENEGASPENANTQAVHTGDKSEPFCARSRSRAIRRGGSTSVRRQAEFARATQRLRKRAAFVLAAGGHGVHGQRRVLQHNFQGVTEVEAIPDLGPVYEHHAVLHF